MYTPKVLCYRITKKKGQELSYKEVYYMILFYKIKGKKERRETHKEIQAIQPRSKRHGEVRLSSTFHLLRKSDI